MTENIKPGDRVRVRLTGSLFDTSEIVTATGLAVGQEHRGVMTDDERVNLDGFTNPQPIWGRINGGAWSVEVIERDPTSDFKIGDKVKTHTGVYSYRGQVGEVVNVEPWGLVYVALGPYVGGLTHYPGELEKIELPTEEPLAEWEKELLGIRVPVAEDPEVEDEEEPDHGEDLSESHGVRLQDTVFLQGDALYGLRGKVGAIRRPANRDELFVHVATDDHGTVVSKIEEVEVLPSPEALGAMDLSDYLILGIIREATVDAGIEAGLSREIVKQHTEAGLLRIQNFLDEGRQTAYNEGFQAGEESETRASINTLEYLKGEVEDLIESAKN